MNTIRDRIIEIAEYKGLSRRQLCKEVGLSVGFLNTVNEVGSGKLNKILNTYKEVSPEWLLTGGGEMLKTKKTTTAQIENPNLNSIPLIPVDAIAGYGSGDLIINDADIERRYVIPDWTEKHVDYMIRVSGSSMYPKYSNGDLIGCRRLKDADFFQWGKTYVLDTEQGPIIKRLFKSDVDGYLKCVSDNKEHYPPFDIPIASVYRYSVVVGVLRSE